jgi:hypothetical protein
LDFFIENLHTPNCKLLNDIIYEGPIGKYLELIFCSTLSKTFYHKNRRGLNESFWRNSMKTNQAVHQIRISRISPRKAKNYSQIFPHCQKNLHGSWRKILALCRKIYRYYACKRSDWIIASWFFSFFSFKIQ